MEPNEKRKQSINEAILLYVLNRFGIPEHAFSIGNLAEQRVCLEKANGIYSVYMVERGIKFEESTHETEESAHRKMMYFLSASNEEYREMCEIYANEINVQKRINAAKKTSLRKTIHVRENSIFTTKSKNTICVGDTIRIRFSSEGGKEEATPTFEGVVVACGQKETKQQITVRNNIYGINVEKTFSLSSPQIASVNIIQRGNIRGSRGSNVHKKAETCIKLKRKN